MHTPLCTHPSPLPSFPFGSFPSRNRNLRMIREFSSVVLMDFLGQNELLVLENPWERVKERLPDVLDRKQYGV